MAITGKSTFYGELEKSGMRLVLRRKYRERRDRCSGAYFIEKHLVLPYSGSKIGARLVDSCTENVRYPYLRSVSVILMDSKE